MTEAMTALTAVSTVAELLEHAALIHADAGHAELARRLILSADLVRALL